jgi:TolB-like protein
MTDIFLSYSRDDQATARLFAAGFEREGFSVWWDQTLSAGENYDQVTERALRDAKAVVVLWSKKSVDSRWVRAEATQADRQGTLVPVMIEPCVRPIMFELKQTAELTQWKGEASDPAWQGLLASLRRHTEKDVAGHVASATVPVPLPIRSRNWLWLGGVVVATLLVLGAYAWMTHRSGQISAESFADVSIAVLPFTNMSSDKEQEYFSDGLTEELLNQLAQVPKLRVIGRTSSFAFKGRNEDLRKIGETLGVNHILEGSVRKAGDRIRITAQLINPANGSHLWSQTYERKLDDIFAIQDEIAHTVADQLKLTMGIRDANAGGTKNLEAFDEFLAGRALMGSVESSNAQLAVPHLERAVKLDPSYTTAKLWLIEAYFRATGNTSGEALKSSYARQDEVIDDVVKTSHSTSAASLAQSYRAFRAGNLAELERLLKEALQVPGDGGSQARLRYARFLAGVGQEAAARSETEQALKNDPLDAFAQVQLYIIIEATGKFDEAEKQLIRLRELPSGNTIQTLGGWVNLAQSRHDVVALRKAASDLVAAGAGISFLPELLKVRMEDYATARKVIRAYFEANGMPTEGVWPIRVAQWAAFFDDRELALQAFGNLVERDSSFEWLSTEVWRPVFAGLRSEPVFRELLRKMGIVDYWRATGNWGDFCKPVGAKDFECH